MTTPAVTTPEEVKEYLVVWDTYQKHLHAKKRDAVMKRVASKMVRQPLATNWQNISQAHISAYQVLDEAKKPIGLVFVLMVMGPTGKGSNVKYVLKPAATAWFRDHRPEIEAVLSACRTEIMGVAGAATAVAAPATPTTTTTTTPTAPPVATATAAAAIAVAVEKAITVASTECPKRPCPPSQPIESIYAITPGALAATDNTEEDVGALITAAKSKQTDTRSLADSEKTMLKVFREKVMELRADDPSASVVIDFQHKSTPHSARAYRKFKGQTPKK